MSHRFSLVATIVVGAVAAVAIAAAAWAGWNYQQSRRPRRVAGPPASVAGPTSTQPASANPLDLASDAPPVLDRDPAGVPPPPGARLVNTVRIGPGQEVGHYLFTGARDVLESTYSRELAGQGWSSLGRTAAGGLLFRLGQRLCLIEYKARPGGQDAEVVVVIRPAW